MKGKTEGSGASRRSVRVTDPREDGAVHAATRATFTPVPSARQARERRPRRVHLLRTSAFRSVCLRADTPAWSLGRGG